MESVGPFCISAEPCSMTAEFEKWFVDPKRENLSKISYDFLTPNNVVTIHVVSKFQPDRGWGCVTEILDPHPGNFDI